MLESINGHQTLWVDINANSHGYQIKMILQYDLSSISIGHILDFKQLEGCQGLDTS